MKCVVILSQDEETPSWRVPLHRLAELVDVTVVLPQIADPEPWSGLTVRHLSGDSGWLRHVLRRAPKTATLIARDAELSDECRRADLVLVDHAQAGVRSLGLQAERVRIGDDARQAVAEMIVEDEIARGGSRWAPVDALTQELAALAVRSTSTSMLP